MFGGKMSEEQKNNDEEKMKERDRGSIIPGVILIVLGILFLLPKLGIDFGVLWPTFILAPGIAFFAFYLVSGNKEKNVGILIPATITTLLAIFFYFESFTDWKYAEKLWPVYPLIVGIAFFVTYLVNKRRDRGFLVPAGILGSIGILFLIVNFISVNLWPLFLILAGLYFIVFPKRKD